MPFSTPASQQRNAAKRLHQTCAAFLLTRHRQPLTANRFSRTMLTAIPCTLMRGGTSKGLYFDERDLPAERELRDRVLLAAMGSPDIRQIDGVGGAHPLTSKVAIVRKSALP